METFLEIAAFNVHICIGGRWDRRSHRRGTLTCRAFHDPGYQQDLASY